MKSYFGLLLLCAALFSPQTNAQVANGDFSGGTASWNWSQKVYAVTLGITCDNVSYVSFTPNLNQDTPSIGTAPASGRVAKVTPMSPFADNYNMCRKIDQSLTVPQGTSLSFAYQIGEIVSTNQVINAGTLNVYVTDLTNNQTTKVFTATGYSQTSPCGTWCPKFTTKTIDMSPYWGKSIKLTFRGSSATSVGRLPSPAFVDNIVVQ